MLYIIISSLLLLIINTGLGNLYAKLFALKLEKISLQILLGIMSTTLIWTLIAFFFPLNSYVEILFSGVGIVSFIYFKSYLQFKYFLKKRGIFFYVLILLSVFAGSFYPFILDHFGYYVPTIEWLRNFGLVKGISNLDIVAGQTSFWHIYQAGFSHYIDPFFRINVFVLLVFILYGFESRRWILLTFVPLFYFFTQSPSPDLPVLVIALILLNEIFNHTKNSPFILAASVFVFCIKPTMLWLPLFCGLYYLLIKRQRFTTITFGAFIFILFAIKNIYVFGYPIFPMSIFDFNVVWKPHPEIMKISSDFGLTKTFDSQYSVGKIRSFTTYQYIYNWLTLGGIKGLLNISLLLSLILFGIFCWIKKKKIFSLLFLALVVKSIIVILISGQYRFYIDVFLVVGFILFYKSWYAFAKITSFGLSLIILSFLTVPQLIQTQIPSFQLGKMMMGFKPKQIIKPSTFDLKRYRSYQLGNLKFNIVTGYPYSFDTPLPAISPNFLIKYEKCEIFPQLINSKNLKSGFIWTKLSDNDRKKLNQIIFELKLKHQK